MSQTDSNSFDNSFGIALADNSYHNIDQSCDHYQMTNHLNALYASFCRALHLCKQLSRHIEDHHQHEHDKMSNDSLERIISDLTQDGVTGEEQTNDWKQALVQYECILNNVHSNLSYWMQHYNSRPQPQFRYPEVVHLETRINDVCASNLVPLYVMTPHLTTPSMLIDKVPFEYEQNGFLLSHPEQNPVAMTSFHHSDHYCNRSEWPGNMTNGTCEHYFTICENVGTGDCDLITSTPFAMKPSQWIDSESNQEHHNPVLPLATETKECTASILRNELLNVQPVNQHAKVVQQSQATGECSKQLVATHYADYIEGEDYQTSPAGDEFVVNFTSEASTFHNQL